MTVEEKYLIHYIAKRSCEADKIESDVIGYCDLTFVIDGTLTYEIQHERFTLGAGDAMFCPENCERFREKGNGKSVYISVNFRCGSKDIPLLPYCVRNVYDHDIDYYLSKLLEIYFQNGKFTQKKSSCLLELILCEMLDKLSDGGENKYVAMMRRFISYNWYKKISLDEISAAAHLSPSYSSAIFKKTVGISITDYITDIRISRASEMLKFSSESVAEIAEKTGFCDIFYFSRTFKKIKGMSPVQYRSMK